MASSIVQCPACGWTGAEGEYVVDGSKRRCPSCQNTMKQL